jgi:hypothetical protein
MTDYETQQRQMEIEMAHLALKRKEELKAASDSVSIEFASEIERLAAHIQKWNSTDPKPRGRGAVPGKIWYYEALLQIDPYTMANTLVRAVINSYISKPLHEPLTFTRVVTWGLIFSRLRAILPKEEQAIEAQHKFAFIDRLLARSIVALPELFYIKKGKKTVPDEILLTEECQKRLMIVDLSNILTDTPMKCKPLDWVSVFHGGYLTEEMQRTSPLVMSKHHDFKELAEIDKSLQANPEVLESVNKMQRVAYKVDENFDKYQKAIDKVRARKIADLNKKVSEIGEQLEVLYSQLPKKD